MKLIALALVTSLLAACSSSSSGSSLDDGGTGVRDALSASDSPVDAPADATPDGAISCNTISNAASVVTVMQVAADPPASNGGTIADGTYEMTAVTIYTGADGPTGASGTAQTTVDVSGATLQVVTAGEPPTRTVTLATSGTAFTATDTCPDTTVTTGTFTATATSLTFVLPGGTDDAGARTVVETFTKE
jgi:hypothetical protein